MNYSPFRDTRWEPPISHCVRCGGEIYPMDRCEINGCMVFCEYCAEDATMTGQELDTYIKKIYGGK